MRRKNTFFRGVTVIGIVFLAITCLVATMKAFIGGEVFLLLWLWSRVSQHV